MKKRSIVLLLLLFSSVATLADTLTIYATGQSGLLSLQMTLVGNLYNSNQFLATSMTGTLNGQLLGDLMTSTGVVTVSPSGAYAFDNLFTSTNPFLDADGIGFFLRDGMEANLGYDNIYNHDYVLLTGNRGAIQMDVLTSFSAEYTPSSPVPEPSSLTMLFIGLGGTTLCVHQFRWTRGLH